MSSYLYLKSTCHMLITWRLYCTFRAELLRPVNNGAFDGLFTSEADLRSLQRSQRTFHTWMRPRVSCVYLFFPHCSLNWPSLLSRSSQQVLCSCGLAQLSLEAGLAYRVYVGHRKRKGTLSNTLEILRNSLRCSQTLKRIYLSVHNDTAQRSGFLSGVVGWDFRKDTNPKQ